MRFAVIGFGYWGRKYVRLLEQHPQAELAAIADPSATALMEAAAAAPGVRTTLDPLEAISGGDIDAVVVATPATTHYALALAGLRAGKAVLCEKPLSTTVDECEELIRAADEAECTLFVGHTFLYSGAIQTAKRLLVEHELGNVVHAHAAWTAPGPVRRDVNALWDLAPHPLSILTYLLGQQPTYVSATGQAILDEDREDVVFLHLRFDELATADIHLSWLAPRKVRMLTLTGDRRLVVFDDTAHAKLQVFDTSVVKDTAAVGADRRSVFLPQEPFHVPAIPESEPLAQQLDHFIEGCCRPRAQQLDRLAGVHVVSVLEAAQSSLADGGSPVVVPAMTTTT